MEEQIKAEADEDERCIETAVDVHVFDLRWFFNDRKNFVALSQLLNEMPNSFYESMFLGCLLDQFWDSCQWSIARGQFIPYLVFIFVTIQHMYWDLDDDTRWDATHGWTWE